MTRLSEGNPEILEGKVFALLSYLSILCILPLIFKKNNAFVLKHAKQGLVIFVAEVGFVVLDILLWPWVFKLGMFVLGVFSLIGIAFVLQGRDVRFPVISEIADSIVF